MVRIGLIGFGAIGARLAEQWSGQFGEHGALAALLVRPSQISLARKAVSHDAHVTDDSTTFFNCDLDVVVEAAGHAAVAEYTVRRWTEGEIFACCRWARWPMSN
jgi:predicted dinucleotide-utilizing enzyme